MGQDLIVKDLFSIYLFTIYLLLDYFVCKVQSNACDGQLVTMRPGEI